MCVCVSAPMQEAELRKAFDLGGVTVIQFEERSYPQEVHHIAYVRKTDLRGALVIASELDLPEHDGVSEFLIVRPAPESMITEFLGGTQQGPVRNVHDERCSALISLVSARSRVSNVQPSLSYVPDARANLSAVTAARHQLIFGRRGAGKTALLVEARQRLEDRDALTSWANIQTYRRESPQRVVLYVLSEMLDSVIASRAVDGKSNVATTVATLSTRVHALLDAATTTATQVHDLIPRAQQALRNYLSAAGRPLYVFLDDLYYLPRADQPEVLDILHGITRDADVWLKVASIRHLTRWWQASPPLGLQSGQDAELIELDITLQDPAQAKNFLEGVLLAFAQNVGIPSLGRVFRAAALDRLVIASGAVPRDYLVLASSAIARAQRRPNARLVGVQEINQAAGDAAQSKLQELEEDMASNAGIAETTVAALKAVRTFCLEQEAYTYFLVGFRDREDRPADYTLLTDLMDVRLIHLIDSGVSDAHQAGHRSEAYMLDLSQYSGARLKQKVRVLDFADGHFISRETRSPKPARQARTAREFVAMLRAAPALELEWLQEQVGSGSDGVG